MRIFSYVRHTTNYTAIFFQTHLYSIWLFIPCHNISDNNNNNNRIQRHLPNTIAIEIEVRLFNATFY